MQNPPPLIEYDNPFKDLHKSSLVTQKLNLQSTCHPTTISTFLIPTNYSSLHSIQVLGLREQVPKSQAELVEQINEATLTKKKNSHVISFSQVLGRGYEDRLIQEARDQSLFPAPPATCPPFRFSSPTIHVDVRKSETE